ncbi:hypothetical protein [Arthrobacter sp. 3Tela_A]|uniref:hypothetical protein n=1 Tax=Arthrobacter sp. 3Tela_A TaxID=3093743 RepID=UPI003BB64D84
MKSVRALKAAGLVLTAVVLGLMTVQGSYALWNAAVSVKPGTVQAANFSILVNKVEMAGPQQTVNLPGLSAIKPGESTSATVQIENKSNASSNMKVQPTISVDPASGAFRGHLTVRVMERGTNSQCPSDPSKYPVIPPVLNTIAQNQERHICLLVKLETTVDTAALGTTAEIPVRLTVTQVKP